MRSPVGFPTLPALFEGRLTNKCKYLLRDSFFPGIFAFSQIARSCRSLEVSDPPGPILGSVDCEHLLRDSFFRARFRL